MEKNFQRNSNALYVRAYRASDESNLCSVNYLRDIPVDSDYESLSDRDKMIADVMCAREDWMHKADAIWNEDGIVDYESAMDALIEIFDAHPKFTDPDDFVRWCDNCGMPMDDGYLIHDGDYYACCESCRNEIYIDHYGASNGESAEVMYEEDCDNGNGDSFYTEWY